MNEEKKETNPQAQPLDPNLVQKPIRTYESDLANALSKKGSSVASISIAEAQRKDAESRKQTPPPAGARVQNPDFFPRPTPIPSPQPTYIPPAPPQVNKLEMDPQILQDPPRRSILKPVLFAVFSLIFIFGGIVVGYLVFQQSPLSDPDIAPLADSIAIPSIIPSDRQVALPAGNAEGPELIAKMYGVINKDPLPAGKNLDLLVTVDGPDATTKQISGSNFIKKIGVRMPDVIFRSLTDRWMFGSYTEETEERTSYLALTTDFFQNAFAGMLIWEDTMPDDLALLLNYKEKAARDDLTSTSTASSLFGINGSFSDTVIRNRDVRMFKNPQGELIFLYSFINKETLVITTTESAFVALVERIEKEAYVR